MARRRDKTLRQGDHQRGSTVGSKQTTTTTKQNGVKSKVPGNDSTSKKQQFQSTKASTVHKSIPAHIDHQPSSCHKTKAMPSKDAENTADPSGNGKAAQKRDASESDPNAGNKRRKLNTTRVLDHSTETVPCDDMVSPIKSPGLAPNQAVDMSTEALPLEVQHLAGKYNFSTMSILSSSKIESRVRNLLDRTGDFSFAKPDGKPGIVILTAKADIASKMGSVVEIAKAQIEKDEGRYWQYNKLHPELVTRKPKKTERSEGRTLAEWGKEQDECNAVDTETTRDSEIAQPEADIHHMEIEDDENEDMDEVFETMKEPAERDRGIIIGERKKVRNIPVMSIYFSRVPVPGLKELYGQVI
ncbi:hypothetical protein ACLMJK_007252 [Lecanora helva]